MKKLIALLCLSPLTAFAAPAEFDIQKLLKPVSKSILAEGPEASSWCDGILIRESYQVCDERPIYEDKQITECHYEAMPSEKTYSFTTPGRYQCQGPVYIANVRYDLTQTEWRTDKVKIGVEKYNCRTQTRWVCEY